MQFNLSKADGSALPAWVKLDPIDNQNLLFGSTSSYTDLGDIFLKITFSVVGTPEVTSNQVFTLSVIDCRIKNLKLVPSSIIVSQLGTS